MTSSKRQKLAQLERADRLISEGNALEDAGRLEAALDLYRQATALTPKYSRTHLNAGNAFRRLHRHEEAAEAFREALRCEPGSARARYNLGALFALLNRHVESETEFREALRLDAAMVEAHVALADVLERARRPAEARIELENALRLRPGYAGAALNLAQLCVREGRYDDAEELLARARESDPLLPGIDSTFAGLYLRSGQHDKANAIFQHLIASDGLSQDEWSAYLFSLNLRSDLQPDEVFREHVRIGEELERAVVPPCYSWNNEVSRTRRLRVGYVSADLRQHPVALFLRPVLEHHNRADFEVHCYSNHLDSDSMTRLLRRSCDHWHDIACLDDAAVVEQIRSDQIDLLIDLSGHTNGNRMPVFCRHPAAVQATWLGYLNTTGLRSMDYRLCDWHTEPAEASEKLHTERLVRLPNSQWCYAPVHDIPSLDCDRVSDWVQFGSFNQFFKITDRSLHLWCQILREVRDSKLIVLDAPTESSRKILLDRLSRQGIDPTRIELRERVGIAEYLRRLGSVDIALDTVPYNGGTTTIDSLWMGTPLIALRGDRGIARGSSSILETAGLPELVVASDREYVHMNVRLAHDRKWRNELKKTLRDRLAASPLMDARRFTADLEAAYRRMWQNWCALQATAL